jgi:tetratricopeptide (TPR) repeat protein
MEVFMKFPGPGTGRWLAASVLLVCVCLAGPACGPKAEVELTDVALLEHGSDDQVETKANKAVVATVANPRAASLKYKWSTLRGRLHTATTPGPTNSYTAPDTPGVDTITVEVLGGSQPVTRSLKLQVVDKSNVHTATEPSPEPHQPASSSQRPQPPNVRLTNAAWQAFNNGTFEEAIAAADRCISEFRDAADEQQAELTRSKTPLPPVGEVTDVEKKAIDKRGLLNDVATCYWIQARAAQNLKRTDEARAAYQAAMNYTHARCWDPAGTFWSPADDARRRRAGLK